MEPLVLPGDLSSLSPARDYVRAAASAVGLGEKRIYALALAVDEIVTNIVMHGYEEHGAAGDVRLSALQSPAELKIDIEDTAPAFDPGIRKADTHADEMDKPLSERPVGGLGIFLAVQSLDRFDYRRESGRNINTIGMRLERA